MIIKLCIFLKYNSACYIYPQVGHMSKRYYQNEVQQHYVVERPYTLTEDGLN
jgi:hypothetical protein